MKNSIRFTGLSHKEEKKLLCFPPHSEFMMNLSILLIPNQNRIIYRELAVMANLFRKCFDTAMLCIAKIASYRTFNPPAQLNKLDLQAKSPISHMPRIRVIHSIAENMIQKAIA